MKKRLLDFSGVVEAREREGEAFFIVSILRFYSSFSFEIRVSNSGFIAIQWTTIARGEKKKALDVSRPREKWNFESRKNGGRRIDGSING